MSGFEYALVIVAVVIGLALTDVAQSSHRLLVRRRAVRWDPLPLLVAHYVLLTAVRMWFTVWRVREVDALLRYPLYVWLFAELFVLFLLAAACLPDDPDRDGADLRAWYEGHRRYIWSLFALFQASYLAHWLYFASEWGTLAADFWPNVLWPLAPLLIYVGLIFTGRRALHYLGLAAVVALQAGWLWNMKL